MTKISGREIHQYAFDRSIIVNVLLPRTEQYDRASQYSIDMCKNRELHLNLYNMFIFQVFTISGNKDIFHIPWREIGGTVSSSMVLEYNFEINPGSAAAEVPVKLQGDWKIIKPNLAV